MSFEEIMSRMMADAKIVNTRARASFRGEPMSKTPPLRRNADGHPLCTQCGKPVRKGKGGKGWLRTCSEECASNARGRVSEGKLINKTRFNNQHTGGRK